MKFLETTNLGGQSIYLDDLRYLQSGNNEAFKAILDAIIPVDELVILQGCISSTVDALIQISEGFVALNGIVYRVPLHTYDPTLSGMPVWQLDELIDPSGATSFQNGLTYDVYRESVYKVVMGTISVTNPAYITTRSYISVLASVLPQEPWHNLTTQIVPPGDLIPGTYLIDYKKDLSGFVHLRGKRYFEDESGLVDVLFATLPVGYRPSSTKTYLISTIDGSLPGFVGHCMITIEANGQCRLKSAYANAAFILNMEQIPSFETT